IFLPGFFLAPLRVAVKFPDARRRLAFRFGIGNFIQDSVQWSVNVIRVRGKGWNAFWDNMELWPGSEARFQCVPPGKFRPGAMHFNEKKCCANAGPNDQQVAPGMICEQLKCVNGSKNQYNPFGHDPQEQFSPRIDGGKGNKNSKVQCGRTSES